MEHFQKLERMYLSANVNTQIYDTTTISISEGESEISLEVNPKYFHALNAMHGSVYFKLLDDAAFFAVNSLVKDVFVLTTSLNINLIRPVSSGKIIAKGKIRFKSQNVFMAEASLVDENNKEIGFGSDSFMKSKVELSEEIGYK